MSKTLLKWAVVLLLHPATAAAQQDPMAIAAGAQVYSNNCARCHNARASSERTDLEWVVIVLHMRARANLTKTQANTVLAFRQATNLPETGGAGMAQVPGNMIVIPEGLRGELLTTSALAAVDAARAGGNQGRNR